MLPAEDRHDVSSADHCVYIQRPLADMGGKRRAVSVFERECSSAAYSSADTIKTQADVSSIPDYFSFERKRSFEFQSGCDTADGVVWTHHYEGVDVPEVELPQDTTGRLRQWWSRFAAEQKAKCDEEKRLGEMKKIEETIAYLQKHSASGSLINANEDGRTRSEKSKMQVEVQEEKRTIKKQESEVKKELEQANEIAAAAKEKDRKEKIEISKEVDQLKHERVSVQVLLFLFYFCFVFVLFLDAVFTHVTSGCCCIGQVG